MGCSTCTTGGGCSTEKGPQRSLLATAFSTLYPDATWGHLDEEAAFLQGVSEGEAQRLCRSLATVAKAPVFFEPGQGDSLSHLGYVHCVGRTPSLLEVRRGQALAEMASISDQYLRVHFSTVLRAVCIQEVSLELSEGWLREIPRPGVYDPKLLKRFQKIVDFLEASGLEHLDFGLLDAPYPGAIAGDYPAHYQTEPTLVNFFFYAVPAQMQITTAIPQLAEAVG